MANKKKIDRALSVLDGMLKEKPDDDRALMVRGRIFLQEERFGSAIKDFSAIIRRNPKSTTALVYRAKSYVLSKDFKNAVADRDRILGARANQRCRALLAARVAHMFLTWSWGLRDLEKARSLKPHAQMFFTSGATYINLDRLNDAIDAYTKTLAMNPEAWSGIHDTRAPLLQLEELPEGYQRLYACAGE
ncbi:tetratricopeptide repeat protein [Candidatus Obscuribacterales bacterium]|nr:tetratricopeptide repeat protein [Candidatus Obscuribacterales bacterium]